MEPFIFGADSGICKERSDGIAIDRPKAQSRHVISVSRYHDKKGTPNFFRCSVNGADSGI